MQIKYRFKKYLILIISYNYFKYNLKINQLMNFQERKNIFYINFQDNLKISFSQPFVMICVRQN